MLASNPSQHLESDSRPFGNPLRFSHSRSRSSHEFGPKAQANSGMPSIPPGSLGQPRPHGRNRSPDWKHPAATGGSLVYIPRLTFLSHFVLCQACAGLAFFAWVNGVPQMIWANDMSMMTSGIGALFAGSTVWLGWQAWRIGEPMSNERGEAPAPTSSAFLPSSDYGYLAERLCVMAGFVGTAIGLSMQARSLAGGAASFTALATSLFTTASGGIAAALIAIMTFNLEVGVRRARR
jgi:hypothetical protein